jgi:hypothetical protein
MSKNRKYREEDKDISQMFIRNFTHKGIKKEYHQ